MRREEFFETVWKSLESYHKRGARPLPVLLEGKEVDLFELIFQVKACGGYDGATSKCLWSSIAQKLGFGLKCGPSLKLVYLKYLKSFESQTSGKDLNNGLQTGKRMSIWGLKCSEDKQHDSWPDVESSANILQDWVGSSLRESDRGLWTLESSGPQLSELYKDGNFCETPSRKRKQVERVCNNSLDGLFEASMIEKKDLTVEEHEPFAGMLEWIKRLALSPGDPKKGHGPRGSNQNDYWVDKCAAHWVMIREFLWKKKDHMPDSTYGGSQNSMKQKIPPALYYKELRKPNKKILEKLRANQIRALRCGLDPSAYAKAYLARRLGTNWAPVFPSQTLADIHLNRIAKQPNTFLGAVNEMSNLGYLPHGRASRKRVPVGSDFQAQVPPWTPVEKSANSDHFSSNKTFHACDSESTRWLGIVVWPLEGTKSVVNKERIRKGRPLSCSCLNPKSVDCVKLHVQQEREQLKLELREAFDSWGFNELGETVSSLWTTEEELAFKLIVRMNSFSSGKDFWDELPSAFPSKSMKQLVSYYFNVFVLRRRAVQNRVLPEFIDSDDDEMDLPDRDLENYCRSIESGMHERNMNWKSREQKGGIEMSDCTLKFSSEGSSSYKVLVARMRDQGAVVMKNGNENQQASCSPVTTYRMSGSV